MMADKDVWEKFWNTQCPKRGPALHHRRGRDDEPGRCAECLDVPKLLTGTHYPDHNCTGFRNAVGRCTICGESVPITGPLAEIAPKSERDIEWAEANTRDNEMKAGGCTGPVWGKGRGAFTERQFGHLNFVRWRTEDDPMNKANWQGPVLPL